MNGFAARWRDLPAGGAYRLFDETAIWKQIVLHTGAR